MSPGISRAEASEIATQAAEVAADKALTELFIKMGYNIKDPKDVQRLQGDMGHLSRWRRAVDTFQTVGIGALVTTLVSGILAAFWLGLKSLIGKG
jgi:hypothetical protein